MKGEVWALLAVAAILVLGWWTEQRLVAVLSAAMVPVVMVLFHKLIVRGAAT